MELLPTKRTVDRVAGRSADDGLAKGMELVLGILLFVGIGWLIDRAAGTRPWFTLGLFALGVIGHFARLWYAYEADMRKHEDELMKGRRR